MADYTLYTYSPDILVYNSSTNAFDFASDYDFRTGRYRIEYSDDDAVLDGDTDQDNVGVDANQTGTAYRPDGTEVESGSFYADAYATIEKPGGGQITIDRLEIDGVHVGYIPSEPLVPGTSYALINVHDIGVVYEEGGDDEDDGVASDNRMSHSGYQSDSVACFARGTRIETPVGPRPVETLRVGDLIMTASGDTKRVSWIYNACLDLRQAPKEQAPILISRDTFAAGQPSRDVVVSPQHRILIGDARQGRTLADAPVFVAAKALSGMRGVRAMRGMKRVEWFHIACDTHEIVRSDGLLSETILLGRTCVHGLPASERGKLFSLFNQFQPDQFSLNGAPAAPILTVQRARKIIEQATCLAD